MKIFILIPAFNEERMIAQVIRQVRFYVDEIIVIDDGSTDKTSEIASREKVIVLKHLINRGQGAALRTGMDYVLTKFFSDDKTDEEKIIVHFDSDGQHRAENIPEMVKPISEGKVEATFGSRFLLKNSSIPFGRKILLKGAIFVNRLFTKVKLTDAHNGFRALSWKAASLIRISQDRMAHNSEIVSQVNKYNLKFQEVPITVFYTKYSRNKGQKWYDSFKIIKDLLTEKIVK